MTHAIAKYTYRLSWCDGRGNTLYDEPHNNAGTALGLARIAVDYGHQDVTIKVSRVDQVEG